MPGHWCLNRPSNRSSTALSTPCRQELEAAQQEGEEVDDPMAWACQRFWKRRAAPLPLSRSLGRLRRCGWVGGGQWEGLALGR